MSTLPARGTLFEIEEGAQFIPLFDAAGLAHCYSRARRSLLPCGLPFVFFRALEWKSGETNFSLGFLETKKIYYAVGATGCVLGLLTSALFDLPSGASIVLALTGTAIITAEVAGRSPDPLFKASKA